MIEIENKFGILQLRHDWLITTLNPGGIYQLKLNSKDTSKMSTYSSVIHRCINSFRKKVPS